MIKRIRTKKRTGAESFIGVDSTLQEYWSWAHSDIASNAERGKLAEYLVARAVKAPAPCRIEWDAVDVISEEGIKIEVKSSAYLQTWKQDKLSAIHFDIAPKNAWDSETNLFSEKKCRSADIYVFCLFTCKEAAIANPMDVSQWEFYVLNTKVLDSRIPEQKTIGLNSLKALGAAQIDYHNLHSLIIQAYNNV